MINCKMYKDDQDQTNFDVEIVGKSEDVIIELMEINAVMISNFREIGISDEKIGKQLVDCIVAGFELEKSHKKKNPKSP